MTFFFVNSEVEFFLSWGIFDRIFQAPKIRLFCSQATTNLFSYR